MDVPGRKWYGIAAGVLFLGMALCGAFLFLRLGGLGDELPQVVVPGSAELRLTKPGTYTIFHEAESVVEGRYYAASDVSGLYVTVASVQTGAEVPLEAPGASSTYSVGGRSGNAVLTFEIDAPGRYRVAGAYEDGRAEPATVLAIGHDFGKKLLLTIVGGIGIGLGAFALALAIAIVTFIKRRRARRRAPAPEPAPAT